MPEESKEDSEELEPKDKTEEKPKKPPGYRNFEKLLKPVVKAPPLKRSS